MNKVTEGIKNGAIGALATAALFGIVLPVLGVSEGVRGYRIARSKLSSKLIGPPLEGTRRFIGSRVGWRSDLFNHEAVLTAEDKRILVETLLVKRYIFSQPVLNIIGEVKREGTVYAPAYGFDEISGEKKETGQEFGVRKFYDYVPIVKGDEEKVRGTIERTCQEELDRLFKERYDYSLPDMRRRNAEMVQRNRAG